MSPICSVTRGEAVGMWNVFRIDPTEDEREVPWTDEMTAWRDEFYGCDE